MDNNHIKLMVVVLLVLLWLGFRAAPLPNHDKELRKVFVSAPNRAESQDCCRHLAKVSGAISQAIDEDSKQADPDLKSGAQLDDMRRRWLKQDRPNGYEKTVPGIGKAVGNYLKARAGDDPGELTNAKRAAWVKAYGDLSQELTGISRSY
jgi:hypothetical protein